MRRNRRGGGSGLEFGGSGEDSFVAVVVTKLTGALLFILLLTMVIMALLPKAVDLAPPGVRQRPGGCRNRAHSAVDHHARGATRSNRRASLRHCPGGRRRPRAAALEHRGTLAGGVDLRSRVRSLAGNSGERDAPATVTLRTGQRRHVDRNWICSACGLPERQAAHHARVVEARPASCSLAGLARPGGGFPGALAGSPGWHEHAGKPGANCSAGIGRAGGK